MAEWNKRPLAERFWEKVNKRGPVVRKPLGRCWVWTGTTSSLSGYGNIKVDGAPRSAHRVGWQLKNGPIPRGCLVLHHCDNRVCVRPSHLALGTQKKNIADMFARNRQHRRDGEHGAMSKLTDSLVRAVREEYAKGDVTQHALAARFGVHQSQVSRIVSRKRWSRI